MTDDERVTKIHEIALIIDPQAFGKKAREYDEMYPKRDTNWFNRRVAAAERAEMILVHLDM